MSNHFNEEAKENILLDVITLTSAELVKELGIELEYTPILTLEAVVLKHSAENFKKKSMLTHDELVDLLVEKRFEELPEGV